MLLKPLQVHFSSEIWANILKHCVEVGEEGVFVAQPTLAGALRISKELFYLAGRALYRAPIVQDFGNFFLDLTRPPGSGPFDDPKKYVKATDNTKLPLLRHVRRLTILPHLMSSRGKSAIGDFPYVQRRILHEGVKIIRGIDTASGPVTPKLRYLTISSCRMPRSAHDQQLLELFEACMNKAREELLRVCAPAVYCAFPVTRRSDYSYESWVSRETRTEARYPHTVFDWHLTFDMFRQDSLPYELFPVVEGSKNRFTIKLPFETQPPLWPKHGTQLDSDMDWLYEDSDNEDENDEYSIERVPAMLCYDEEPFCFLTRESDAPFGEYYLCDQMLRCLHTDLYDHDEPRMGDEEHEVIVAAWAARSTIKTTIEIYGLEKLLVPPKWTRKEGRAAYLEYFDSLYITADPAEATSWPAYIHHVHSQAFLQRYRKKQVRALRYMERVIRRKLNEWRRRDKRQVEDDSFDVRLFMATDYPGCAACGQGARNEWALDRRPRKDDDSLYDWSVSEVLYHDYGRVYSPMDSPTEEELRAEMEEEVVDMADEGDYERWNSWRWYTR
ncbi:hypothetical protein IAU59_002464 [Kwoniella sp. CBS 9459]